jgi:hypothetical protein
MKASRLSEEDFPPVEMYTARGKSLAGTSGGDSEELMNLFVSVVGSASTAYRDGKILVVPLESSLPATCVKCGAPAARFLMKTFRWHDPWLYLLILPGLIFYAIVALVVQRKARIDVPFCQAHFSWRTRMNIAGGVLLIGFIPATFLLDAIGLNDGIIAVFAVVTALSGLIVLGIVGSSFAPIYIDETCAKFKGAGEQFLSSLPTSPHVPQQHLTAS